MSPNLLVEPVPAGRVGSGVTVGLLNTRWRALGSAAGSPGALVGGSAGALLGGSAGASVGGSPRAVAGGLPGAAGSRTRAGNRAPMYQNSTSPRVLSRARNPAR